MRETRMSAPARAEDDRSRGGPERAIAGNGHTAVTSETGRSGEIVPLRPNMTLPVREPFPGKRHLPSPSMAGRLIAVAQDIRSP